jgi:L-fuculose-phosphate aldolase
MRNINSSKKYKNFGEEIRQRIIDACIWMQEKELVFGTWGNISVREGDMVMLTPSRIDYDKMERDDLVVIDLEGKVIEGKRLPTSEKELHRQIYLSRKDVGAVVHNHSVYATAVACIGHDIPAMNEEMSQVIGGEICCTKEYIPAGRHAELAEESVRALGGRNASLIQNHGIVCCGVDLEEALIVCLIAEKAARIYMTVGNTGNIIKIPDELIQEERDRYLYKYGKE